MGRSKNDYEEMFKNVGQVKIMYEDMLNWVKEIYIKAGQDEEDATYTAENLVMTDLRSVYSHGVMRVPMYFKRMKTGCTSAKGKP